MKPYIAIMASDSGYVGEPDTLKVCATEEEAGQAVHNFFLSYDFILKEGEPFDPNNDDDKGFGFRVFDNVKMENEKVVSFMHAGGDGPVGYVRQSI